MIAYVYFKWSQSIYCKIFNVQSINISDMTKIIGEDANGLSSEIRFGGGSDYIILQESGLNVGDTIDLTGLEDCRNYFILGKDAWLMEQLNKANVKINNLQTGHDGLRTTTNELQCFSLDLQYQIDIK